MVLNCINDLEAYFYTISRYSDDSGPVSNSHWRFAIHESDSRRHTLV